MLSTSALSTQDELGDLLTIEEQKTSERAQEAICEYQLAKQVFEDFAHAMRTSPPGITATDGILIVNQLAEQERNALYNVAQALQELYDHNQQLEAFIA